jgi:TatD DNase family protein
MNLSATKKANGIISASLPRKFVSKKKHPFPCPSPLELGLPQGGADTHAHLHMEDFSADLPATLERAFASGVSQIGNVLLHIEEYDQSRELFAACPQIFFILGIHPNASDQYGPDTIPQLRAIVRNDARVRAIGEIGLDFFRDSCTPKTQETAFRALLKLAREMERPVVIHSRDATQVTLAVLEEEKFKGYPLLWHCFGGDTALMEHIIRQGWRLSIPGPVGYPGNTILREAARNVPLERLLLETDAPYLAPLEWRGKRNEPAFTVFAAACIAHERGMDTAELWMSCGENARRFFSL